MSERKTIIRTVGLKKHYTVGGNTVRALDGVDMSVLQGEFVCVAGRSGSGKSTMLNMLAGLEPPTEGEIIVRGKHHLEAMDERIKSVPHTQPVPNMASHPSLKAPAPPRSLRAHCQPCSRAVRSYP